MILSERFTIRSRSPRVSKKFRLKLLTLAAVIALAIAAPVSRAHAAEKTIPIDFVGDWCRSPSNDEPEHKDTAWYTLPSWTEGGHCTGILSITKDGFYFSSDKLNCDPVKLRLGQVVAQSGTAYKATVTASCQPDGPTVEGKLKTFELYRYKGRLSVTPK
jgi:hypothetical protein